MRIRTAAAAVTLAAGVFAISAYEQPAARPAATNSYVDPARCAQCHASIAESFARTGMGRSFSPVGSLTAGAPFYHGPSDSYFATIERSGKFYQRRWQIGFDGKETNVDEKSVDFVLGSGNHAQTYLHLTPRNTLQQLPLGWYAENGGYWAMNPGYDRAEYQGSTRAIHYECMFCHNAYPRIPSGHEEAGAEARYSTPLPAGIDCQRCHGPGERHVAAAGRAGAKTEEIRAAIVNPSRLAPEREMEVCLQCHLETTSRQLPHSLLRRDRGPYSYKPSEPLGDFRLAFDRTLGKNEDFEIAHAGYRLRDSQCFLKSEGKLRCTSCHNPHDVPRGDGAIAGYNRVCGGCHSGAIAPAVSHATGANCVSCHMPRRRTDDVVHVVMTDHKIVRRPPAGDLLAEKQEKTEAYRGEVALYYPGKPPMTPDLELDLALAQVTDRSNLKTGLPRLSALVAQHRPTGPRYHAGLGEAWRSSGDLAKAIAQFEEAARRAPRSEIVALQLGNALMESSQWEKAESAFLRAKSLRPDDPAAWGLLGWVQWQQDKAAEAKSSLEAAIRLDHDSPELRNYLGQMLLGNRDVAGAEREFRAAVRINPGVMEWRTNLGTLLAARGQLEEAAYQAKAAIRIDRNFAAAHELLGRLLSAKNDFLAAAQELELAVRLRPDSGKAHYELAIVLQRLGNSAGALEHFRAAAQSDEPQVKALALEVLRRMGR